MGKVLIFNDYDVDEHYCLLCLRDLLRQHLSPLEEGENLIPKKEFKKQGISISRYDLLKGNV